MYLFFTAIILGIVEGLTEFIPVSSTGHLILAGNLLGFIGEKANTFEVVIQLGAILAVAIIYWKKIVSMLHPKEILNFKENKLNVWHIAVAIIPIIIVAFLLHKYIKEYLFSPFTVIIGLVVGAIVMIIAENFSSPNSIKQIDKISMKQALLIGLIQCLSLWPGFSRAGATISGGLFAGLNRKAAAEFSFIIAIPVMIAASGFDMLKMWNSLNMQDLAILAVGFIVSFIVAYAAVLFFLRLLDKYSLRVFAYYRFAIAFVAFLYFYM